MKRILYIVYSALVIFSLECCGSAQAGQSEGSPFEYRDVFLPDYTSRENSNLGLNTLDDSWAVWGHNLKDMLPEKPSLLIYSKIDGDIDKEQFCFSEKKLYDYVVDYINDNYPFERGKRFAIMPNDNDIVCLCAQCVKLGNEEGNASPSVHYLIRKLAKKFPEHQFFTSYYSTTSQIPEEKMEPNSGIIVSAMDYPLSPNATAKEKAFIDVLASWKDTSDKVYVWDYIDNFDDYFTPFPIFTVMQRRLQQYRDAGVDGVFMNGSGYDFSTFARLRKAVLAGLMENPDADWEELLRWRASEMYPVAGDEIADFMIAQEKYVASKGKALPMYEGVPAALATYLPEKEFLQFYNRLLELKKDAPEPEIGELRNMADAMAMTVLELKRLKGKLEGTGPLKDRLRRLRGKDVVYYNEACWGIDEYLDNYEYMEREYEASKESNLLKGVKLNPLTPLDEDYSDISMLTDGLLGLPSNYHNGNLISSADPALKLQIPRQPGMKKLKVWCVYSPGFKIGLPQEVTLYVDGLKMASKIPEKPADKSGHSFVEFDIPAGGDIVLSITRNPDIKTMAIDEIQAF